MNPSFPEGRTVERPPEGSRRPRTPWTEES